MSSDGAFGNFCTVSKQMSSLLLHCQQADVIIVTALSASRCHHCYCTVSKQMSSLLLHCQQADVIIVTLSINSTSLSLTLSSSTRHHKSGDSVPPCRQPLDTALLIND